MFERKQPVNKVKLEDAITRIHAELTNVETGSDDYQRLLLQLERLHALKPEQAERRVTPDAIVAVVGNIIGVLIIVGYEREHVLTSKAMNYLMKKST